jgi:malate dehydrogenase (oxaloacetate-decarboxylating)
VLAGVNVTGVSLHDQRFVIFGFGSAGLGIAELLRTALVDSGMSDRQARARFYAVDKDGLLVEGMDGLSKEKTGFARAKSEVEGWARGEHGIGLLEVVERVRPTVLIGVSGQAGAFNEDVVRAMTRGLQKDGRAVRPMILPLSNPTSRCEAAPSDVIRWSEGRAIVGTGSPFAPVEFEGQVVKVAQTNNSYIFPGMALGIVSSRAKRVSEGMMMAAAKTLAEMSPTRGNPNGALLPPLETLRAVSLKVALALGLQAADEGLAEVKGEAFVEAVHENIWEPVYLPYRRR